MDSKIEDDSEKVRKVTAIRKEIDLGLKEGKNVSQLQTELSAFYSSWHPNKDVRVMVFEEVIRDYLARGISESFGLIKVGFNRADVLAYMDELIQQDATLHIAKERFLETEETLVKKQEEVSKTLKYQDAKGNDRLILVHKDEVTTPEKLFINAIIHQFDSNMSTTNIAYRIVRLNLVKQILGEPNTLNKYSEKIIYTKALAFIQDKDVLLTLLKHFPRHCYAKIAKDIYLSAFSTLFDVEVTLDSRIIRAINNLTIMHDSDQAKQPDYVAALTFYLASLRMDTDKIVSMLTSNAADAALKLLSKEIEMLLNTDAYQREYDLGRVTFRGFSLKAFAEKRKDFYKAIILHDAVKSIAGYQQLVTQINEMIKLYGFLPGPGLAASMAGWLASSSVMASNYAAQYLPTTITARFKKQIESQENKKDPIAELREKIDLALKEGRSVRKDKQELTRYYLDSKNWPNIRLEDVVKDFVLRGIRSAFFWMLRSSDVKEIYEHIRLVSPENFVKYEMGGVEMDVKIMAELTIVHISKERSSQPAPEVLAKKTLRYINVENNDQYREFDISQVSTYVEDWLQGIMEAQDYIVQAANESPEPMVLSSELVRLRSNRFDLITDLVMSNLDRIRDPKKFLIGAIRAKCSENTTLALHVQRIGYLDLINEILGPPKTLNQYSQFLLDNNALHSIEDSEDFVRFLNHFPCDCYTKIAKSLYIHILIGSDDKYRNSLICKLVKTSEHYECPADQPATNEDKIVIEFYTASSKKDLDKLVSLLITDSSKNIAIKLFMIEIKLLSSVKELNEFGVLLESSVANDETLKNTVKIREDFYRALVNHERIKNLENYNEVLTNVEAMFKCYGSKSVIPLTTRLAGYVPAVSLPTLSDLRTNLTSLQTADTASRYLSSLSGIVARYRGSEPGVQAVLQQEPRTDESKEGQRP